MNNLIQEIKNNNQDYEFYPTTQEIIKDLEYDLTSVGSHLSVMDVGAGNGNLFKVLDSLIKKDQFGHKEKSYKKYAIEKSQILINNMDSDIFVVGTDFHNQTFIDKEMDVIFCNPPYSEFKEWTIKLIKESNCKVLYLVIPDRWLNDEVDKAISDRKATHNILGSYSFIDSEYRKARANVNLIRIDFTKSFYKGRMYGNERPNVDPFDLWFNEHFNIETDKTVKRDYERDSEKREEIKNALTGENAIIDKSKVIPVLLEFYKQDTEKLLTNYKALEVLDSSILQELNVNLAGLKEGLKIKIKGLKNLYWKELFNNLDAITSRLAKKSRESLLSTLTANTSVDFNSENIYSVVIWAIKNSNKYIDSQLLDLYENLTETKNIIGYKSNQHMIDDTWRYNSRYDVRKKAHHYTLDYRCIIEGWYGIGQGYEYPNGLSNNAHDMISDIFTIAKNLDFEVIGDPRNREWESGKKQLFYTKDDELFVEIKAFKNGNLHYKLNQNFMKKFNIEAGRLNGWIKSPKEAVKETGITIQEAQAYFKCNTKLLSSNIKLLGATA